MKRYSAFLLSVIFIVPLLTGKGMKNYTNSFFGVYGKKASVMGRVDGSAFEVWIYPYKVLHDLEFRVLVDEAEANPYTNLGSFDFSHICFEREFIGETWTITERLYPAYREPVVYLAYRVHALTDLVLEFLFKPDLSPMWPAALGGKYSYFDQKENVFILSESTSKNAALFGGYPGKKVGNLPAHRLPGGRLRYRIPLKKGIHEIPLAVVAAHSKYSEIKESFHGIRKKYDYFLKEREELFGNFLKSHLTIETPDLRINKAIRWAILNVQTAFVDNPELGEGLIAGYGLSGERERPGFGWYFGGDGLINSFAVLNYGDFSGAGKEIEFLLKYQRKDGKIMHELSQGAGFIDWFGDYGFPFFHGDTTLYFASFLDFYLQRTGDINIFNENRQKIDLVFSWLLSCDGDKDGIVETNLAGVGASETGPLRQKMKTDIYLAALSVKSWEAMGNIYAVLKDTHKVNMARERLQRSKKALEKFFWDNDLQYFAYAVKDDGLPIKEITIWPAIAMRFKVPEVEKGRSAGRKISSPELSADWGTRFLSSKSGYYDAASYNNGAVWPFLTGFSSLALYNYGNPYHGFSLLQANFNIIMDYDYGAPTELLSGDIYRPLDQSVPNQIWSSGNTISALVEGLLGFEADALKKEIRFKPAIPLTWPYLKVGNLKVGKGSIGINFKREKNRLEYMFDLKNLRGYTLTLEPEIPALRKSMTGSGKEVSSPASFNIVNDVEQNVIVIDIAGYVYPYVRKELRYGGFSREPIIENFRLQENSVTIDLWGKGSTTIDFYSDGRIEFPGRKVLRAGDTTTLIIDFDTQWERKRITGKIEF